MSLARCFRLAVSGMSYRLLRSGITTGILALAVAFLVYVLIFGLLAESTQRAAWRQLEPTRASVRGLTRLSAADDQTTILAALAAGDGARLAEFKRWAPDADADWSAAVTSAQDFMQLDAWFGRLSETQAAVLQGGQPLADWLSAQQDASRRQAFTQKLRDLDLAGTWAQIKSSAERLFDAWPGLLALVDRIQAGHRQAIDDVNQPGQPPLIERLRDPETRGDVTAELRDAGFALSAEQVDQLGAFAAYQDTVAAIQTQLDDPVVRRRLEAAIGSSEIDDVMRKLADDGPADWWPDATQQPAGDGLAAAASRYLDESAVQRAVEGYEPRTYATPFGLPPSTLWLVGLSLLVCAVGVTNALMMSVTERFHEIATMKCLGAMDGSVMKVFVIEALIQGLVGGAGGLVLGLCLALLRGLLEFGGLLGMALAGWPQLLQALGLSLLAGLILATAAAVAPSLVAARLAPMEAMRVE